MEINNKTCLNISWEIIQGFQADKGGILHPAIQIYIWCLLALAAQMLGGQMLLLLAAVTTLLALGICSSRFLLLLRRTRWILFSVLLIYIYTSPGNALWPQLGIFSPVVEGITEGIFQLLRLTTVVAGLSVLLALLSQSQLIAGFYTLSRPLILLGLSRERVAVRLALTLRYAEGAMQNTAGNWRSSFEQLLAPVPVTPEYIEMHAAPFCWRDGLLAATASAVFPGIYLLWRAWP